MVIYQYGFNVFSYKSIRVRDRARAAIEIDHSWYYPTHPFTRYNIQPGGFGSSYIGRFCNILNGRDDGTIDTTVHKLVKNTAVSCGFSMCEMFANCRDHYVVIVGLIV